MLDNTTQTAAPTKGHNMSKTKTAERAELLSPEKAQAAPTVVARVGRIIALQGQAKESLATFAVAVVESGFHLVALKEEIPHGKWEEFYHENIESAGLALRTGQRYMQIAKKVQAKSVTRDAFGVKGLLSDGSENGKGQIQQVIGDMTDATTWNQLLIDFGLLREHKQGHQKHNERKKTREELQQIKIAGIRTFWIRVRDDMHREGIDDKSFAHLERKDLESLQGVLIDVNTLIRKALAK